MAFEPNWEEFGYWGRYHGVGTVEDVLAYHHRLFSDPRSDEIVYRDGDFTDVESVAAEEAGIERVAAMDWAAMTYSRRGPLLAVAVVPARIEPVVLPLLALFREVSGHAAFITRSRAEARERLADELGRERFAGVRLLGEVFAERR